VILKENEHEKKNVKREREKKKNEIINLISIF